MYKLAILISIAVICQSTLAAPAPIQANEPLQIKRKLLGSGEPGRPGIEQAQPVGDFGVWHVPQYLPGYPSAATIWPRVISVKCRSGQCEGYAITPEMGPGEYLFFAPSSD